MLLGRIRVKCRVALDSLETAFYSALTVNPSFHYPSWRPELTAQVDGCWRVMETGHLSTRVVETGLYPRFCCCWLLGRDYVFIWLIALSMIHINMCTAADRFTDKFKAIKCLTNKSNKKTVLTCNGLIQCQPQHFQFNDPNFRYERDISTTSIGICLFAAISLCRNSSISTSGPTSTITTVLTNIGWTLAVAAGHDDSTINIVLALLLLLLFF